MANTAQMILCIVNQGYEEKVIEAANTVGITGGTFLGAHGLSKLDAEKFFGIAIHPEKQIVLMIVPAEKKAAILSALYDTVGIGQEAQGIALSIPVDDVSENLKKQLFSKNTK
jgi:hypothetical protein